MPSSASPHIAIAALQANAEHRSVKAQRSHQLSQYAEMKSMRFVSMPRTDSKTEARPKTTQMDDSRGGRRGFCVLRENELPGMPRRPQLPLLAPHRQPMFSDLTSE